MSHNLSHNSAEDTSEKNLFITMALNFFITVAEVIGGIISAIINASTLIIISFFLIKEAIDRFSNPTPIAGSLMLIVASLGLIANVAGTLLLKKGSANNLNIRAAYFHLLSDAVSSLAVIIGARSAVVAGV